MIAADGVETSTNIINGKDVSTPENTADTAAKAQEFENAVSAFEDEKQGFEEAAQQVAEATEKASIEAKETEFVDQVDALAETEAALIQPDRPASDGTFGKREYVIASGDTLEVIAGAYGQTVDDLLIANPGLSENNVLEEGQVIAIYDETRLDIARQMAAVSDPEMLSGLVRTELLYATHESSTPQDLLAAVTQELFARRDSGDEQFASIVETASSWATSLWTRQGRTHEVIARLQYLTNEGNSDALNRELYGILRNTAMRSPTSQAVDEQVEVLLRYGPAETFFINAVNWVADFFNFGQVQEAAANIAYTYSNEGAEAAACLLSSYTDPCNFDALTSARLLYAANDTTSQIITHLGAGDYHLWLTDKYEAPRYYHSNLNKKEAIFGDLSEAVQNASKSPEAARAIERMANEINVQMYTYVANSIINGRGTTLPIEMMLLLQSIDLYLPVTLGLDGLGSKHQGIVNVVNGISNNSKRPDEADDNNDRQPADLSNARLDEMLDRMIYGPKR